MGIAATDLFDVLRGQRGAVDGAPGNRILAFFTNPLFVEHGLAAHIKRNVIAHAGTVLTDKTVQTAKMVAVAMAEDQPVELAGIDIKQIEIAVQDFRRETENTLRKSLSFKQFLIFRWLDFTSYHNLLGNVLKESGRMLSKSPNLQIPLVNPPENFRL